MKRGKKTNYIILLKIFFFTLLYFTTNKTAVNKKKRQKTIYIEIIIPGSCLYSPIQLIQKTEEELWREPNLKNRHKNESNKLAIEISEPLLSTIKINKNSSKYFSLTENIEKEKGNSCQFFIFNWPGKRTKEHFFNAAKILYHEIKRVLIQLKKEYEIIIINIIGYSHGGNIGILLTHWISQYNDEEIIIDKIFLLGTPIGKITIEHINIKNNKNQFILKKIINCYNPDDWIQTFDRAFDLLCQQEIPTMRKNIRNKIVIRQYKSNKISNHILKKGYSIHMYYLEEEFLCNEFFNIKNNI